MISINMILRSEELIKVALKVNLSFKKVKQRLNISEPKLNLGYYKFK